ncbi:MAG: hypothetical protein M1528_01880, partial [Candidatus Marsarchaeota archaeon]|nr:hypothetical protein [Candidatus Marsarchaeota archaeon]
MATKGEKAGRKAKSPKERLEEFGEELISQIDKERSPKFVTLSRSRSNIKYDEKQEVLVLGENKEERNFVNVGQAKRFMQTTAIAAFFI